MNHHKPHRAIPLTGLQRFLGNLHDEARSYWLMPCWIEVDMHRCQEERAVRERRGEPKTTYTSYIIKAVADAIRAAMPDNPEFNAALVGFPRKRLICFDQVDAAVTIERRHEGDDSFFVGIIRDADTKSTAAISAELAGFRDESSPSAKAASSDLDSLTRAPALLRRLLLWLSRNIPGLVARHRGTFFLSTVGKYGVGMYLMSNHNLSISFSEITSRPVVRGDAVVISPVATLTLVYDHRVMMGAPVARLMADIRRRLEAGPPDALTQQFPAEAVR
jgi:pyruvate/2-oxoglutarate dehydrogenase complex dihydrolipoamide acyltransferase (E2) component